MAEGDSSELWRQREALNTLFRADQVATSRCAHQFPSLPLWRVQWISLPAHNEVLNVHVPHYTHMFTELMSTPPPHYYGAFHLEGGSRNLDSEAHALEVGEVGILCEIVSALALDDGRLIIAARNVGRVVVEGVCSTTPYTRADCSYFADEEELELFDDMGTEAALQAPESAQLDSLSQAVRNATLAAAAAAACAWASLEQTLEPRAGAVSPFGQLELRSGDDVEAASAHVSEAAASAANQAARRALGLRGEEAAGCEEGGLGAPPLEDDDDGDVGSVDWREWRSDEESVPLPALETALWNELLTTWAIAARLRTAELSELPCEIRALMPPAPPGGWDQPPSSAGGGPPCVLPGPVRRYRASYLLTALLPELVQSVEQRLELLQTRDVRTRLLLILHELVKQRKVLSAVLALRDAMGPTDAEGSADGSPPEQPGGEGSADGLSPGA